jgi:hypothetical protein
MKGSTDDFENHCMISCGMLRPEIEHLIQTGFLNPSKVFYTPPGLHALPQVLESHLVKRVEQAQRTYPDQEIIVVYGSNCYMDPNEPDKGVDTILKEIDDSIVRVQGEYGYDMLADIGDRQLIGGGRQDRILWFTTGWLKNWRLVYQKYFRWDRADANANFPGYYDKIIVLDAIGLEEEYSTEKAEEVLELFDWTGLEVQFRPITLDRFKGLLRDALHKVDP